MIHIGLPIDKFSKATYVYVTGVRMLIRTSINASIDSILVSAYRSIYFLGQSQVLF